MHEIIFEGRVLPERRRISIPIVDAIHYSDPAGFEIEVKFQITNGIIEVTCLVPEFTREYVQICMVRAYEFTTALVDMVAFSKGLSLSVIIDDFVYNGKREGLALSEKSLASFSTALNTEVDFVDVWNILSKDLDLRFALRDLIASLSTLNYSAIAACRAVEAIRKSNATDEMSDAQAWDSLRVRLRLDRDYLQFITDASRDPRHGKRGQISGESQMEISRRAWVIMNRYLVFLKLSDVEQLPSEDYPLLKHDS